MKAASASATTIAMIGASPREAGARRAIRHELPCLEDGLSEWLWNVAYRRAMM
jgi:hypothetical protein